MGFSGLDYTPIRSPLESPLDEAVIPVAACRSRAAVGAFPAAMPIMHVRQLAHWCVVVFPGLWIVQIVHCLACTIGAEIEIR